MKPIKVNGVVVCCSNCINHQVSPLDEPCKDCWKAIFHSGNIDEVRLDDIVFYPADKERFLTDGLLLPVILSALMTMTSLMLTQQSLTSSLNLSQGRPSHDGFGFYKSALFAGLSGR